MNMYQEVAIYLNKNKDEITKQESRAIVAKITKKFNVKKNSAAVYYYQWKREFIGSYNCVPRRTRTKKKKLAVKSDTLKLKAELSKDIYKIQGVYGEYIKSGQGVKIGDEFFRSEAEIEKYKKDEIEKFMLRLGEILEVLEVEVAYE